MSRRQTLACPSDPAGAPSGLRWRVLEHGGWRLWRGEECVGAVLGMIGWRTACVLRGSSWLPVATGPIATVAHELVREVRRG